MRFTKVLELFVILMISFMVTRLITRGDPRPRWDDINAATIILCGLSPYGDSLVPWLSKRWSRFSQLLI